jgi:prolyl oligopeptidase
VVDYPHSRRDSTRDTLHGRSVADPYRWLEDPDAADTADWVRRQNEVTETYLADLPERNWFATTMAAVLARPRAGTPLHRGGRYLVSRNDGRQDQDVWYVADSLAELLDGGRVLVDPNTFSADGTSSLAALALRGDGRQLAYAVSEGGSDWHTFRLLEVDTGAEVADVGVQTKFSEPVWLPDGRSFG